MRRYLALGVLVVFALCGAYLAWAGLANLARGDNATSTATALHVVGVTVAAVSIAAFVAVRRES